MTACHPNLSTRRQVLAGASLTAAATLLPYERADAAVATPTRIMTLGDSITGGTGGFNPRDSYRSRLHQYLGTGGNGFTWTWVGSQPGAYPGVGHEGHSGWTVQQIHAQIGGWLTTYTPDLVLLHIGTNNVSQGEDPAVTIAAVVQLIETIRTLSPAAWVFYARICDVAATAPTGEQARNTVVANGIPKIGPQVVDADMRMVGGVLLADNVHPNTEGYYEMARQWYRALRWTWPPAATWKTVEQMFPTSGCAA